jgi:uncharacterized protein DUF3347
MFVSAWQYHACNYSHNIKSTKMKLILLGIAIATSSFNSCNNNNSAKQGDAVSNDITRTDLASQAVQKDSASIENVLTEYLKLKNALVAGKSKDASDAATSLKVALEKIGGDLMTATEQKIF